jgi:hypothetical protein
MCHKKVKRYLKEIKNKQLEVWFNHKAGFRELMEPSF